jgi:hypothetical protein
VLPGSFNLKWSKIFPCCVVKLVLNDLVDATAPRSAFEREAEGGKFVRFAGGDDFDVSVFSVANPAMQAKCSGFAVDIPAEADTLHAAFDEVVTNHNGWTEVSVADAG